MRAATALLLIALCLVPAWAAEEEIEDFPRPAGQPKPERDAAELPPYPDKAPTRPAGLSFKDQDFFWFNDNDGKQQWEDPTLVHVDEEGNESYVDPETGKATDAKPAEAAWLSLWDEEHESEYFFNEITRESTWDVPYLFAWHKVFVDENNTVLAEEAASEDFDEGEEWEEGAEFPDGSFEEAGFEDGAWHDHESERDHDHQPSEEEIAEEEVLRQEAEAKEL